MAIGENWTKIGDLPKRRNHHALINFDSKMWVIGGQNPEKHVKQKRSLHFFIN